MVLSLPIENPPTFESVNERGYGNEIFADFVEIFSSPAIVGRVRVPVRVRVRVPEQSLSIGNRPSLT